MPKHLTPLCHTSVSKWTMAAGIFYRHSGRPRYAERFRREVGSKPLASLPWPPKERVAGWLEAFRRS